jgi:MoaA/NifB/PqqE/SkfB family radical SAM enzyme
MDFSKIKVVKFELSDFCNLKCPTCIRHEDSPQIYKIKTLKTIKSVNKNNISLSQVKKWFPETTLQRIDAFEYCGQAGEPGLAPDILEITEYLTYYNKPISFCTNGTINSPEWWEKLARIAKNNLFVIWSPDSLKPNNNLYRIGASTEKFIENITAFNFAGGKSLYNLIVFDHNKDEIDAHMNMSLKTKCEDFKLVYPYGFEYSNDYTVVNKNENKKYNISTIKQNREWNFEKVPCDVKCRADVEKTIEISAAGILHPCCWTGPSLRRVYSNFYVDKKDTMPITDDTQYSNDLRYQYFVRDFVPILEQYGGIKALCLDFNSFENIVDKHPLFTKELEKTWGKYGLCNLTCSVREGKPIWDTFWSSPLEDSKLGQMRKRVYEQKKKNYYN